MKRIRIISWLLPCICAAAAVAPASGQTKVKTSVEKVTLFIDGAQVTRTRQIDLPAGNSTLVFTGLSPYLDDKSMQVAAKGKFTVTAVNRLFNHTDSLERSARQKALEQELARIRLEQQQQKAAREVIAAETDLLKVNCSVGNRNAATPLAAIKELNEYYASRMQELKRRTLELDGRTKALGERERQVLADLAQLGGRQSAPMSEVEVRIEAPAACKGAFTLTYYVRNAGWFPSYDIRSGGLSEPVEISYKANIFQNTREEWKNVGLTLSSSNPTTGNIAPAENLVARLRNDAAPLRLRPDGQHRVGNGIRRTARTAHRRQRPRSGHHRRDLDRRAGTLFGHRARRSFEPAIQLHRLQVPDPRHRGQHDERRDAGG